MTQQLPSDLLPRLWEVIVAGDPGYAEASRTFTANGAPAMVVRPRHAEDVARAVQLAAVEGLALSVRSGGHSMIGPAPTSADWSSTSPTSTRWTWSTRSAAWSGSVPARPGDRSLPLSHPTGSASLPVTPLAWGSVD